MKRLDGFSRILAIRLARLGDLTLLLPSLGILKNAFPRAHVALLTDLPYAPLAHLCPWVDDVITIDRLGMRDGSRWEAVSHVVSVVRKLRAGRFDLAIDFHSFRETNLLAWVSGARCRMGMKRADRGYLPFCFNVDPVPEDKEIHVADMFRRVVSGVPGLTEVAPAAGPSIRTSERRGRASLTVALYVGAFSESRRWPPERFAAVASHVIENWGASVVVVSGIAPTEQDAAVRVAALVPYRRRVRLVEGPGIPELAGVLASADLLVSNDSGPMHVGSALGVPTLGIFSESKPLHYQPTGPRDRYVRKDTIGDIEIGEVLRVLEEMREALSFSTIAESSPSLVLGGGS